MPATIAPRNDNLPDPGLAAYVSGATARMPGFWDEAGWASDVSPSGVRNYALIRSLTAAMAGRTPEPVT